MATTDNTTNNAPYQQAVTEIQRHLVEYASHLTDLRNQIVDNQGFVRVLTKSNLHGEDNWVFWTLHEQLLSLERKVERMQTSLKHDSQYITSLYMKEELPKYTPFHPDPYMRWSFEIVQKGVELMPLEQLGNWTGVRAFLESFPEDQDDQTNQTETDETEEVDYE